METPAARKSIGFLLVEEFSMMSLTAAIEPLRAANRLLGEKFYSWHLISHDGTAVPASNRITVDVDAGMRDAPRTDFLFVCASLVTDPPYRSRLNAALNAWARRGTLIGSLSGGTFILARAGLLEGIRCTIHWEYWPTFEQQFPFIDCVSTLYEIDHDRYTCAGGTASMDLMLHLIDHDHGPAVSRAVANQFQLDRIRRGGIAQRSGQMESLERLPPRLQNAVSRMLLNLDSPLSTRQLAADVNISVRNMERLFRRHFRMSPARYYMQLRLQRARDLLIHSNLSILEVAIASGFSSSSYFASCFSRHFGENPSVHRSH